MDHTLSALDYMEYNLDLNFGRRCRCVRWTSRIPEYIFNPLCAFLSYTLLSTLESLNSDIELNNILFLKILFPHKKTWFSVQNKWNNILKIYISQNILTLKQQGIKHIPHDCQIVELNLNQK